MRARMREEATFGRLPVLAGERAYGTTGMLAAGLSYAMAAWCLLIGGYAANLVGAAAGITTLLGGCIIGVSLAAATALPCNRYGLEQIDVTKSCYGQRGAKLLLLFYVLNQLGWAGLMLTMCGRGVSTVLWSLGINGSGTDGIVAWMVLLGLATVYVMVARGFGGLEIFNPLVTPGLCVVTLILLYVIFRSASWQDVLELQPLIVGPNVRLDHLTTFEYGLGAGLSFWPGLAFLSRHAGNQRQAFYAPVLTMGLGVGLMCCTGLLAALVFRTFDPTQWLVMIGGPMFSALTLVLIAAANIAASVTMLHTAAVALRHHRRLRNLPWPTQVAITGVPLLAFVAFPTALYERGSMFLALNAAIFAPVCAVLLVDYAVLRRGRMNMSQVFEDDARGHYWFFRGINVPALACTLVGQAAALWLNNPITRVAHPLAESFGASLPGAALAAGLYLVFARLMLVSQGTGGYRAPLTPVPLVKTNIT